VNRTFRALAGLVALVAIGPGCGPNSAPPTEPGQPVQAGANTRIPFKEEYKQMIGKDGKMLWKPSQSTKRPPGIK
jgi:hypothetical protein